VTCAESSASQKCFFVVLLEAPPCLFLVVAAHVADGFISLSLLPWELHHDLLSCWYFSFSPYSFDFLFCLGLFVEVLFIFNFTLNFNFSNTIFSNMIFIFLISNFLPCLFCKTIIDFQFHPSIQIDYIMFSNLILIVLIFIFFLTFL
jgi:hypothetical protein